MEKLNSQSLRDLIYLLVVFLVDDQSAVHVEEIIGEHTTIFKVSVAKDDIGKVIGKQGNLITSIRTILLAASAKARRRTVIEILD